MTRVVVADDSRFTRELVASYLTEGGCEVVGFAHDAATTVDVVRRQAPDVLTLDLQMPGGQGLDLLQRLTADADVAIVVISGVTRQAAATTLKALEFGAVDFVLKYTPGAPVSRASLQREIVAKVKTASLAQRIPRSIVPPAPADRAVDVAPVMARPAAAAPGEGLIVIGASTGGPRAIAEVLRELPTDFGWPCVIVQHLPASFTAPFAAQLGRFARIPVTEAIAGQRLEAAKAYVTPGAFHLHVCADGRIDLHTPAERDVFRPSIDRAMKSAVDCYGAATVGVVLTGMGDDGAEGARCIRAAGGETYVQDPTSCVVASMPERTIERAGADHIARPARIGQLLAARGNT